MWLHIPQIWRDEAFSKLPRCKKRQQGRAVLVPSSWLFHFHCGREGGDRREGRQNNQSVITQRSTACSDGMCHVVTKSNHNQSRWRGSGVTGAEGVAVWEEGDTCWLMAAVNQPSSTQWWFGSLRERARRRAAPLLVYGGVSGTRTWLID